MDPIARKVRFATHRQYLAMAVAFRLAGDLRRHAMWLGYAAGMRRRLAEYGF